MLYFGDHIYSDLAVSSIRIYYKTQYYEELLYYKQISKPCFDRAPFKMRMFLIELVIFDTQQPKS